MKQARRLAGYAVLAISLIAAAWVFTHRQYIADQLIVWQYQPSANIKTLAINSGMSKGGKFDFYASQPVIETAQSFNQHCTRQEEQSAILGCYVGDRIYVYDVTNKTLNGIKAVTAAHEMLHAAYARLSEGEKNKVDLLLEAEYKKLDDAGLKDRMDYYQRTEPSERLNELHSILGTEYAKLSPELEDYYRQYFDDRQKVTTLHQAYASVFKQLEAESKELSGQLEALSTKINSQTKQYNSDIQTLNTDILSFNDRVKHGSFSSRPEFESQLGALNARSSKLDTTRSAINGEIDTYNKLRDRLLAVNSRSQALNSSIDSTLSPVPSP